MTNTLVQPWVAPRPLRAEGALLRLPQFWLQRRFLRNELAALDARQMRGCGLDAEAVRREAAKPFWRD
jgi:uncharacterized protein YjiS (DUF1127 family)